jgi:acetamidase/formamidase
VGYSWASAKPFLTVRSGDTVEIQTVSGDPAQLERAGVNSDQIQQALRAIYSEIPQTQRGPGVHLLTGPVAIEGAEPGDVLEVRILEIKWTIPMRTTYSSRAPAFFQMSSKERERASFL